MRRLGTLLVASVLAASLPWPAASAQATASAAFPPAQLHLQENAPQLVEWLFDKLGLSAPDLAEGQWANGSQAEAEAIGAMGPVSKFSLSDGERKAVLDYTLDGYLRSIWLDAPTAIRAADASQQAMRGVALEVASRLGIPAAGAQVEYNDAGDGTGLSVQGALPWGAPFEVNGFRVLVDDTSQAAVRFTLDPWFEAAGTPSVSREAAQATATARALADGARGQVRVTSVGAAVVNGSQPAWVFTVFEGDCGGEVSSHYVDGETGDYLGRGAVMYVDAVCSPLHIWGPWLFGGAVGGSVLVAASVWWRWRIRRRGHDA